MACTGLIWLKTDPRRAFVSTVINPQIVPLFDRLCGLVVSVPGYRCRSPGSIPGATRSSRSGTGSTQPREYN
jgi:hypothetical protein